MYDEHTARSVMHDARNGYIVVGLTSGAIYSFPTRVVQGLSGAPDDLLSDVHVSEDGMRLIWEKLAYEVFIPTVLSGKFGTKSWMDFLISEGVVGYPFHKGDM